MTINQFELISLLYDSPKTHIWRAKDKEKAKLFILKIRKKGFSDLDLQYEFQQLGDKKIPHAVLPVHFFQASGQSILVFEDHPGNTLESILDDGPLSLLLFLDLALNISKSLESIHQSGLIHSNLTPANILYDSKTQQVWLLNFTLSREISSGIIPPYYHEHINQLSYIPPEQTGLLNRPVDERSDFYSLGCLFYTLLTGAPPFVCNDPLEMAHAHVALPVTGLIEQGCMVPPAIEAIILKLLNKDPNDRYQSIKGLIADWQYCIEAIKIRGNLENFTPGQQDHIKTLRMPETLYGRQREINQLKRWFNETLSGQSKLVLIGGYSGAGKTSLVSRVEKELKSHQIYFISGKFEEYRRNIPYFVLAQAIESLCQKWLLLDNPDFLRIQKNILAALGNQGQALSDIVPELQAIIGKQPDIIPLGSIETQNRIDRLFQQFFIAAAEPDHPIILFMDDLQWADHASLRVLNQILASDAKYLLVIGCYRSNEVDDHHIMNIAIKSLQRIRPDCIAYINIHNLSQQATSNLISDMLQDDQETISELTQITYQKTQGNPFYTIEFIRLLHTEKLLVFNLKRGIWQWDKEKICHYRPGDNVVDVVIQKIGFLPDTTLAALKVAACIGREFPIIAIAVILQVDATSVFEALLPAIEQGIIASDNMTEASVEGEVTKEITAFFLHDRLQEGAYRLMSEEEAAQNHLLLGQTLYEKTCADSKTLDDALITIIGHLNQAIELLSDKYRLILARLNHQAGIKAKSSSANMQAIKYFEITMDLLGETGWEHHYETIISAAKNLYICYYLTNEYQQADTLFYQLTHHVKTQQDLFDIYYSRMVQCMVVTDFKTTLETGRQFIQLLGHHLPEPDKMTKAVAIEEKRLKKNLDKFGAPYLLHQTEHAKAEDAHYALALIRLQLMGYFVNYDIFRYSTAKALNLAFEKGKFPNREALLSNYVMYLLNQEEYEFANEILQLAKQIASQDNGLKSEIWHFQSASIDLWVNSWEDSLKNYEIAISYCTEEGNQEYAGYVLDTLVNSLLCKGEPLSTFEQEVDYVLKQLWRIQHQVMSTGIGMYQQFIKCIRGQTLSPCSFDDQAFFEDEYIEPNQDNSLLLAYLYGFKNFALYVNGEYEAAYQMAILGKPHRQTVSCFHHVIYLKFYAALTYPLVIHELAQEEKQAALEDWTEILAWFDRLSQLSPRNFLNKAKLIRAEKAAFEGDFKEALLNFEDAIEHASYYHTLHEAAFACERFGRFWLSHNRHARAIGYLKKALHYYHRWGATVKIELLKNEFPEIAAQDKDSLESIDDLTPVMPTSRLDSNSILKTAYALSDEIVLQNLMEKLIQIVIENAGADFAAILLVDNDQIQMGICRSLLDKKRCCNTATGLEEISEASLPKSILLYTARTHEQVLLNLPDHQHTFSSDPYFRLTPLEPKSLLCAPVIYRGEIICLLYMENHHTSDVFTTERLELLRMIAMQAAVAIQNASLFKKLGNYKKTLDERIKEHAEHMTTLIAGIAHEVSTPLGAGLTTTSHMHHEYQKNITLFEKGKLSKTQLSDFMATLQEGLDITIQNLNHAIDLVKNFHRLSLDQSLDTIEEFDLIDYIHKILYYLKPVLKKSNPVVTVIAKGSLIIKSYPGAISQLFTNLVNNSLIHAFEFMEPEQGYIDIEIDHESRSYIIITYTDNGCGMPPEVVRRFFEPLFTTKATSGGSGLGGYIIQTLVKEQLGGTIECQSSEKIGTTFTITLPRNLKTTEVPPFLQ